MRTPANDAGMIAPVTIRTGRLHGRSCATVLPYGRHTAPSVRLGHASVEIDRLIEQARFFGDVWPEGRVRVLLRGVEPSAGAHGRVDVLGLDHDAGRCL